MNRDSEIQFTYGCIVQIKDTNEVYKDKYFFIDYVSRTELFLNYENEESSESSFDTLFLKFDEQGNCLDTTIKEIHIIYKPTKGYASIHKYLSGSKLKIIFQDDTIVKGTVIHIQEDMITFQTEDDEILYIDFQYRGIPKEYKIKSIDITEHAPKEQEDLSLVEDVEEYFIDIYTLDQQINDYIDKNISKKNKKSVKRDIQHYKEMFHKYTNLENGIILKELSKNSVRDSFFELNPSLAYPVSSYICNTLYSNVENNLYDKIQSYDSIQTSQFSSIIKNENNVFDELKSINENGNNESFLNNKTFLYQKKQDSHKIVITKRDSPFVSINHQNDYNNINHQFVGFDNKDFNLRKNKNKIKISLQKNKYTKNTLIEGERYILNGIMVHNINHMHYNLYGQVGESLITKTIKDLNPFIKLSRKQKVELFNNTTNLKQNHNIYIPIKNEHTTFGDTIDGFNLSTQDICEQLKIQNGNSYYDIIKQLSFLCIHELNKQDIKWIKKIIQKNNNDYKQRVKNAEKEMIIRSSILTDYDFNTSESLFTTISTHYTDIDFRKTYPSELLYQTMIDNAVLLLYHLKEQNRNLYINFDNNEIQQHIEEFNASIQEPTNTFKSKYVKIYDSHDDIKKDNSKIILKDPPKKPENSNVPYNESNTQILHTTLMANFNYTDTLEEFYPKLKIILNEYNPEMKQEEKDDLETKLFGNQKEKSNSIFRHLITKIIELQVRKGDKCMIEEDKSVFVYDGTQWITSESVKSIQKKRKMLKVTNSTEDFTNLKETLINDYILSMIDTIQNEKLIEIEKSQLIDPTYVLNQKKLRYNMSIRKLMKYNMEKISFTQKYENSIDEKKVSGYILSPYLSILYKILEHEDLEEKYQQIDMFVSLFCLDNHDPHWYHCILTDTKLCPKYLTKLSRSYLMNLNYQESLRSICLNEGTISEHGDMWIHKYSGFMIQKIDFDTNYGFDDNGFKIKMDDVPDIEDDDQEEEKENIKEDVVKITKEDKIQIIKEIQLNQYEVQHGHLFKTFMNTLGINIPYDECKELIKESFNIFSMSSLNNNKYRENKIIKEERRSNKIYSILTVLLIYIQSSDVYIKKSFPGCIASFDGFPLNRNQDIDNGVHYMSCILEKVSKKIDTPPYSVFSNQKAVEIKKSMKTYIKHHTLQNSYIVSMLYKARNLKKSRNEFKSKVLNEKFSQSLFRPCLTEINIKHDEFNTTQNKETSKIYENTLYHKNKLLYITMKIQEHIQKIIVNEKPILNDTQYKEPFLTNYCCDKTETILDHLNRDSNNKEALDMLLISTMKSQMKISNHRLRYLKPMHVNVLKSSIDNISDAVEKYMYSDETVYRFMIHYGHFNDDKPIESFVKDIIVSKPPEEIYSKEDKLYKQIQTLKENGFNYTHDMMIECLNKKANINRILNKQNTKIKVDESTEEDITERIKEIDELIATENTKFKEITDDDERGNIKKTIQHLKDEKDELTIKYPLSELQKDAFEFKWSDSVENLKMIESKTNQLEMNYSSYVISNISNYKNEFEMITKNIDNFNKIMDKSTVIQNMKEILYSLICIIPQILCVNKVKKSFDLNDPWNINNDKLKRWDFDTKHLNNLHSFHKNNFVMFDDIQMTNDIQKYIEKLSNIYKFLLIRDTFNENIAKRFTYMKYLFYNCLNYYTCINNSSPCDKKIIESINIAILKYLFRMRKYHSLSYDNIKKLNIQVKQSEKFEKTRDLGNMSKSQRRVETEKMKLKLGDWSYGTDKRVFKYYKELYSEENTRAENVKKIMREMYDYQNETNTMTSDIIGDVNNLFQEEETEGPIMMHQDDEYINEYGEEVDIDDNY